MSKESSMAANGGRTASTFCNGPNAPPVQVKQEELYSRFNISITDTINHAGQT